MCFKLKDDTFVFHSYIFVFIWYFWSLASNIVVYSVHSEMKYIEYEPHFQEFSR